MSAKTIAVLQSRAVELECTDGIQPTKLYPRNDDVDRINRCVWVV